MGLISSGWKGLLELSVAAGDMSQGKEVRGSVPCTGLGSHTLAAGLPLTCGSPPAIPPSCLSLSEVQRTKPSSPVVIGAAEGVGCGGSLEWFVSETDKVPPQGEGCVPAGNRLLHLRAHLRFVFERVSSQMHLRWHLVSQSPPPPKYTGWEPESSSKD